MRTFLSSVETGLSLLKHSFKCRVKGLDWKEAVVLCWWVSEIKERVYEMT